MLEMSSSLGDDMAPHVLAIPFYVHAHITPMMRFTTQLARKGITISFVCFEDAVPGLTSGDISSELRSLNFRFITIPCPTLPEQSLHVHNSNRTKLFEQALAPLMEKFTLDTSAGVAMPNCIISDIFLSCTLDVADKVHIPRYILITSGVIFARYIQVTPELFESGKLQISETDGRLIEFDGPICIPGLPPLQYHDFNQKFAAKFNEIAESMMKSTGLLVNSFFELEERVIESFQIPQPGFEHTKAPKIYPVGPFFSTMVPTSPSSNRGLEDSSSKCLQWLSSQPPSSVLYIAFGSMFRLRPEQIIELAHGLEASDQHFLWVLPQEKMGSEDEKPSITEGLPQNFEARVGDRGCIVTGWAPQLQILAHSSTGGFLTHSGWNSSLESIISGVPMICWPQDAEQHLNCRYLVEDLKIAEELERGKENFVEGKEIERAVRCLMVESGGTAMRNRVQELKKKAAIAMAEGGSQSKVLQEFLNDIHNL